MISILIVVVLPAPFGPSSPKSSPSATSNETPRTASTSTPRLRKIPVDVLYVLRGRAPGSRPSVFEPARSPRTRSSSRRRSAFSSFFSRALSAEATRASFSAWAVVVCSYASRPAGVSSTWTPRRSSGSRRRSISPPPRGGRAGWSSPRSTARGARRAGPGRPGAAGRLAVEVAEDLPLAPGQAVLRARLLHHPLDPPAQTHDPVDDPLDPEIELGRAARPGSTPGTRRRGRVRRLAIGGNYSTSNLLTSRDMVVSLSTSKYSKSRNRRWRDVLRRRLTKDPGRRPHRGAGA